MNELITHPKRAATPVSEAATDVTEPQAPPHTATAQRWGGDHQSLHVLLDQTRTIAELLNFNFSSVTNFECPSDAPGLAGMVQCVVAQLTAAEAAAKGLSLPAATRNAIHEASSLGIHLGAASTATLLDGRRCFNYSDAFVGMCYWTLARLVERAIEELTSEASSMNAAAAGAALHQRQ